MDCIFNKFVPKSTNNRIIIPPTGKTFISGIASTYSENFPKELQPYLSESDFIKVMAEVNDMLLTYWPCLFSFCLGYLCCPCSLGLSFLIPNTCIGDAVDGIERELTVFNNEMLRSKGLKMEWKKQCSTSWFEITRLDNAPFNAQTELIQIKIDIKNISPKNNENLLSQMSTERMSERI